MNRQRGFTLIELIVAITVIGLAGAALVGTLSYLAGTSGLGLRQAQAQSLADSYLAEIIGRSFADPDGADGEANPALYDDVDDYIGFTVLAPGNFPVRADLAAGGLGALPNGAVWRVDVTVDYDANASVIATGYRTNHP